MTATYPFTPNTLVPFSFQPTLDGQPYNAIVSWNLWGQRYYLNLYSASGELVVAEANIGSLDPVMTPLLTSYGLYTASIFLPAPPAFIDENWSVNSTNVPIGTKIEFMTPNGTTRLSELATASGVDPNASFSFVRDLIAGYGFTSTLVFYASSQNFVTDP